MGSKKKSANGVQNGHVKTHDGQNQNGTVKPKEKFPDPFAVTWAENYSEWFDKVWLKIPKFLATFIVTTSICTMGLGMKGECLKFHGDVSRNKLMILRIGNFDW